MDDERMTEIAMIKRGSKVVEIGDEWHVGEVVARDGKQVKVVWAKGSESWVNRSSLRLVAPMRAYQFAYQGVALGGIMVVIAANAVAAEEQAKAANVKELRRSDRAPIDIWPKTSTVVYNWDGDY